MINNLISMTQSGLTALTVVLSILIVLQVAAIVYLILKNRRHGMVAHTRVVTPRAMHSRRIIHSNRKSPKNVIVDIGIYILLVLISIIWVFPFVYLILCAFRGESTGMVTYLIPKELTFNNFVRLFQGDFLTWYLNTLIIAIVVSIINTMITLLTAYALSRMRFKGRQALMKFMLILGMFPGFLGMICIYYLLNAMGMIGSNLSIVGLMLIYVSGTMMGYYVSKGFFDTISRSLDEAAMIDGASRAKIFFSIILPLSKPIIIQTLLGAFVGPWGDYMMANYIVGRGGTDFKTAAIGLYQMVDTLPEISQNFTMFCAGGVVVSILPIIMFFFMQRFYVAGVTGGSVKG